MSDEGSGPDESPGRALTALVLVLATAFTFVVKLEVAAPRAAVGHGDVAHYVTLARNLATGGGMWVDFVATWLDEPTSTHSYGAGYWMPMPAWLGAIGMVLGGTTSVLAGCQAMIALTSLAPLLTFALGRDLLGSRALGLGGAVLAAGFHLFVDKATLPLTHGCVLVFGAAALWATARSVADRRFLWLAGAAAACAHMSRSDGIVWAPTIVLTHLWLRGFRVRTVLELWPAFAAWVLVLAPFLALNVASIGEPWPASLLSASLLTTYPDLYSLPERLTLERFLAQGWGVIAAQKGDALLANLTTFATGLASGGGANGADKLVTWVPHGMVVLAWLGARPLLGRRLAPLWLYVAAQLALYSLIFTFTGVTSFRPAMYALYPVFLVLVARGTWLLCRTSLRGSAARARVPVCVVLLAAIVAANVYEGGRSSHVRARGNQAGEAFSAELVRTLVRPNGLGDATFLVPQNVVHRFHAHTGLPAASIPFHASVEEIRAAALRVGATHVLLDDPPPAPLGWQALRRIASSEGFERVAAAKVRGQGRVVYRVVE